MTNNFTRISICPSFPLIPGPQPEEFKEPIVRSSQLSDTVSMFLLDMEITPQMSPGFTLLVYHVMEDGEVVADSMEFNVEPCFDNQVNGHEHKEVT